MGDPNYEIFALCCSLIITKISKINKYNKPGRPLESLPQAHRVFVTLFKIVGLCVRVCMTGHGGSICQLVLGHPGRKEFLRMAACQSSKGTEGSPRPHAV